MRGENIIAKIAAKFNLVNFIPVLIDSWTIRRSIIKYRFGAVQVVKQAKFWLQHRLSTELQMALLTNEITAITQ